MQIRPLVSALAFALLVPLAACASDGAPPASDLDCETVAAEDVLLTGPSHFTDTGPFSLTVEETASVAGDRVTVLVSVQPSEAVGYDPLLFYSECRGGEAVQLGVYVPGADGAFSLLFTTQEGEAAGDVPLDAP